MKKQILSFIGLALFVGAVAFNLQTNSSGNQQGEVTLKSIKVLTATASEASCTCYCDDDNGECTGYESCDCSMSDWYIICDDITTQC